MTAATASTGTCGCGCSTMPTVTSAEEACQCGCDCCSPPVDRDEEIERLRTLRDDVERRLAELEGTSGAA